MPLQGESLGKEMMASLTSLIPQVLDSLGPFKAITPSDILALAAMQETRELLGCTTSSCLTELGMALGAGYMVTGSVLLAGDTHLLQLQLTSARDGRVEARVARNYEGGPAGLVEEVRIATKMLVRELLDRRSGMLVLTTTEEGATVKLDGAVIGSTPLSPAKIGSGLHNVVVEKDGFVRATRDIEIKEGADNRLDFVLVPSEEYRAKYKRRAQVGRAIAWTTISVGAASLVTGASLWIVAADRAPRLNADIATYATAVVRTSADADALTTRKNEIATMNALTVSFAVIGAVATAVGVILHVLGDDPSRYDGKLDLRVGANGAALTW